MVTVVVGVVEVVVVLDVLVGVEELVLELELELGVLVECEVED